MNLRPKTVRRVLVLALLVVALAAGSFGAHLYNQHRRAARTEAERVAGLDAYAAGDFEQALQRLGRYVARVDPDSGDADLDAVFAYAVSRSRLEASGGRHLAEAINTIAKYVLPRRADAEVRRTLLDLYVRAGRNDDAVALADAMLKADANDAEALRARATALARTNKLDDALAAARKLAELQPGDVRAQLQVVTLMDRLGRKPEDIVAYARGLSDSHPNDARFELVLAAAHATANDRAAALQWLRQAAQRPATDAALARELTRRLDGLKLFDESRALLERSADGGPEIRRLFVGRLWQDGRHDEVVRRLADVSAADPKADAELVALRALSLAAIDRKAEAIADVAALRGRKPADTATRAWVLALEAVGPDAKLSPRDAIARLRDALSRDQQNGLFRFWIGEAYWALGEAEMAVQTWKEAAAVLPAWYEPPLRMSQAKLAAGRIDDALADAQESYQRLPALRTLVNLVTVRFRRLELSPSDADAATLLAQVAQIQAAAPNEPRTLPIQVALLARTGHKDDAIARVKSAVAGQPPLDAETLFRLAAVSRAESLGLAQEILDSAGPAHRSPLLALSRATDLAAAGKADDGAKLLTDGLAAARASGKPGDADDVAWQLALAQYREWTADKQAAADWVRLGDAFPENLEVQRTILSAADTARTDRAFIARTIDRLRALTGDQGQQWKLERVKWLLASRQYDDSAAAVYLLTENVQRGITMPRVYLARALEQTGNINTAIEHLKAASDGDPREPDATLELVRILRRLGRLEEARKYVVRLGREGVLKTNERLTVASLLLELGEAQRAIDMLAAAEAAGAADPASRVLLADLYRRRGVDAEAERLYDVLLSVPEPSSAALLGAADFYAATDRREKADAVMARFDHQRFAPVVRELAKGRFEELHGSIDAARAHFDKAGELAGSDVSTWQRRIEFETAHGNYDRAVTIADEALARIGTDERLAALRLEAVTLRQSQATPNDLAPLIASLSKDPTKAPQVAMLKALRDARTRNLSPQQTAEALREVADKFQRFLPLQEQVVRLYLAAGRARDAFAVAQRTMDALPGNADAAALAVDAARAARRWPEMRQAAEAWHARQLRSTLAADVALAEALRNLGQPEQAVAAVTPHLSTLRSPTSPEALRLDAARTLFAANKADDAALLLPTGPANETKWRELRLAIAGNSIGDAATAARWINSAAEAAPASLDRAVADAWASLAMRVGDEAALRRALDAYAAFAAKPEAVAADWLRLGLLQLAADKLDDAEASLRKTLELDRESAEGMNNLAYVLWRKRVDLPTARDLAVKATLATPTGAAAFDTLARIELALGHADAAKSAFETALENESEYLDALVGLAGLYQSSGQPAKAAALLKQIDGVERRTPAVATPVRTELQALRAGVSTAAE
jgi:Flp pilus assembly protein TadD